MVLEDEPAKFPVFAPDDLSTVIPLLKNNPLLAAPSNELTLSEFLVLACNAFLKVKGLYICLNNWVPLANLTQLPNSNVGVFPPKPPLTIPTKLLLASNNKSPTLIPSTCALRVKVVEFISWSPLTVIFAPPDDNAACFLLSGEKVECIISWVNKVFLFIIGETNLEKLSLPTISIIGCPFSNSSVNSSIVPSNTSNSIAHFPKA